MKMLRRRKQKGSCQGTRRGARRLVVLSSVGCMTLLGFWLALTGISMRFFTPRGSPSDHGELSWRERFGTRPPALTEPSISVVPSPLGSFDLPEVLSVEDAVEWQGRWILLDRRIGKIHFVEVNAGLMESWGRKGPGPGELQDPTALAVQDSTLWVLNQRGFALDRFSLSNGFEERHGLSGGGCAFGLSKGLAASSTGGLLSLRICPAKVPGPGTAWVEQLRSDGTLRPLASLPLGDPGSRRFHFLREPALAAGSHAFFLGTWDAPCISRLDLRGFLLGSACLPEFPRPLTPAADRSKLERRFRQLDRLGLLPIEVPKHLPWYDRLFATPRGLVVRRIRGEEERDLLLLLEGDESWVTDLLFPESTFVGEETILTARDLLQGTRIQVFPNPWR